MAEPCITLVSRTNDPRDDGPKHAVLHVPQSFALYLANLHDAIKAMMRRVDGVYCIEIWNGACDWGTVKGYDRPGEMEWQATVPEKIAFEIEAGTELNTVKVMDDGVLFSAQYKNDDSGVYFESPTLSWTDIERMAKAESALVMAKGMPVATIDYTDPEELDDGSDDDDEEEEDE